MKSCIQWRKSFKYLPQIDEFNIDYKRKGKELIIFLDQYGINNRINIKLSQDFAKDDLELLKAINGLDKYKIALTFHYAEYPEEMLKAIEESGITYYFCDLASDWDTFLLFIQHSVSDIFISGELGFDLIRVSQVAKEHNIQLRAYANVCQQKFIYEKQDILNGGFKSFFIRPEDMQLYSQYINIIEFYDVTDKQNVYYEIYFKDKQWNGNLQEILKGLNLKINNYYILGSEFARRRSQCQRKCLKGHRCQLCEGIVDLANTLENSKDYQVFKKRG